MSLEDRVKLSLAPKLGRLRAVLDLLRTLPWPQPLQRLTQRGLERLTARIPELAELLEGPRPRARASVPRPVSSSLSQLLLLLSSRDYRTRAKAVQALAAHDDPDAVDALVATLRDRSVEVAVEAARTLALIGGPTAHEALLAALKNVDGYYHSLSRAAAAHGLGTLFSARAEGRALSRSELAPLEQALRDLDAEVSIAAISALVASAGTHAAEPLSRVIENADGFYLPVTRLAAARGLERLTPIEPTLLERLREREVDALVIEVLERLRERARATPQA